MTGTIKKIHYEIKEIEWRIAKFFTESQEERQQLYDSPPFSFTDEDGPWFLLLYPRKKESDGFVFLKFFREVKLEYSVECYFGLKRSDGSVEQLSSAKLEKGKSISDPINLIKKSELMNRKFQLVPGNALTITVTMKFLIGSPSGKTKSRSLIGNGIVNANNQKGILNGNGKSHDLVMKIGTREFTVHQDILRHSNLLSQTFELILDSNVKEKSNRIDDVLNCDPKAVEQFLLYICCGKVDMLNESNVFGLYHLASKYDMVDLKEECCDLIMKTMTSINIFDVFKIASNHNDTELLDHATECFCNNVEDILNKAEWQSFMRDNFVLANDLLKKSVFKLKNPKAIELMTVE